MIRSPNNKPYQPKNETDSAPNALKMISEWLAKFSKYQTIYVKESNDFQSNLTFFQLKLNIWEE